MDSFFSFYVLPGLIVLLQSVVLIVVLLIFVAYILYADRKDMIRPELREYVRQFSGAANFAIGVVFLLSVPVALISPLAATVMWLLVFVAGGRAARWARARA